MIILLRKTLSCADRLNAGEINDRVFTIMTCKMTLSQRIEHLVALPLDLRSGVRLGVKK